MCNRFLILLLCSCWPLAVLGQDDSSEPIDFATQIQPLLSDRCFTCHGPDQGQRQGDLRLDIEEDAKDFAIAPGDPDDSDLLARIETDDPYDLMPPPSSKLPALTKDEVALIREWIRQGAKWGKHWSFVTPQKHMPPTIQNPTPEFDPNWVRNPIDAFVLNRLAKEKIRPSTRADRATLIRRLAFDITGLPPTEDEVDAFSKADQFDDALNSLVDRLLASPHYGERMASDWLDVARYSDTYGYQVDRDRRVWPWRDWVVDAFNSNQPYDDFVVEQIAGDLLPNASDQQILATTFNRLHPQKVEGGSVEEEFRVEYVADRTQTFATAFLGLTMECSRCHDHKYDPLSQKEYYELSAYFDNIDESGLYSFFTNSTPTPTLDLPTDPQREAMKGIRSEIAQLQTKLAESIHDSQSDSRFQKWAVESRSIVAPEPVFTESFEGEPGQLGGANQSVKGRVGKAVQLTGDDAFNTKVGNFRRQQPFSVSLWVHAPESKKRAVIFHRSRAWTDAGSRGYQLLMEDGRLSWSLIHFWPGNAIRIKTAQPIAVNQWVHVTVTYDGSSQASGLKILIDGKPVQTDVVRDNLSRSIAGGGGDTIAIGERFRDYGFTDGKVDELQVYDLELSNDESYLAYQEQRKRAGLETSETESTSAQLKSHFHARHDETIQALKRELAEARSRLYTIQNGLQQIMVMRELATPRSTFFRNRGAYDQPGEIVQPGTPDALGAMEPDLPANRLGLARWLVDRKNPLAARVYVNRVWQLLMGHGLVRTPEDFGVQGQPPTHPKLLDWLAVDFMEHDWDIKRLVKQIVTSSTYLQASTHRQELLARDPENRWLARGPRHRLSAEMLRDNALSVGGLLSSRRGGAASKPYEVEVSFKPVGRDKGEGLYRRSLYTYWKRTGPAPVMMALDASKRDVCRVRRENTSSPLQAFVLMNSPQFVEAARGLAERLVNKHAQNDQAILKEMYRVLTSHEVSDRELSVIQRLLESQIEQFQAEPDSAKAYLSVGEKVAQEPESARLAALTVVANALLGFDDAVMKK